MERFSPVAERKEAIFPYLLILDELDEIARGYDFQSLGINPVRKTGALVTRHAAKWIHFKNDDERLLSTFFKWAEDRSRFSTVDQQSVYILRTKDVKELLEWNRRTVQIVAQIGSVKSVSPYVLKGFESLHADLAKRILTMRSQLSEEEFLELATGAAARPVIDEIANHLYHSVIETTDVATLRRLLRWTMLFGQSIRDRGLILPSYLEKLPGQTCLEAVAKLAYQGRPAGVEIVDDLVDVLGGGQLVELTSILSQMARGGFHSDSAEFLAALGKRLVRRTRELGLTRSRVELERAVGRLAMAEAIGRYPLAGLYRCGTISITLLKQSDVNFCVGITLIDTDDPALSVDTALCRVLYDLQTDEFVAYQYIVRSPYDELPLGANAEMRFTLQESAEGLRIQGKLALGTRMHSISAKKIQDFSLPVSQQPPLDNYAGTYTGTMNGQPLRLTISRTNDMVIGWAVYTHQRIRVDFPYAYFDRNKNAIYLTTEQLGPANVKHLRGVLDSQGNLTGDFIVGGTGKTLKVQLQKQKEQLHVENAALAADRHPGTAVRRTSHRGGLRRQGF